MNYILLFVLLFIHLTAPAKTVEKVLAIVNDQVILLSDVESFRSKLNSKGLIDETLLSLRDPAILLKDRQALIDHLIDERILDSEVKRANLGITIERVEQEIRNISAKNRLSRADLKAALKEKGIGFSDYQDFVRTTLERQALIDREVSSKIKISDDDVSTYYLKKKSGSGLQVYEYALSHILFLPANGGESAALARAKSVKEKVTPSTFDKLAEKHSEDPNFSQGGLLGSFKAGEMLPEIESGVKGLEAGGVSDVIKTRLGYHIIKVNKKTLIADPGLNQEREQIRSLLFAEAFRKQVRLWLNSKREDSFIRVN